MMKIEKPGYVDLMFVALIAIVVALLSLSLSSGKELWLDETHSALLATLDFNNLLLFIMGDVHPPLYFIMLWLWEKLLGSSPESIRLFSISANAIATLVFYFLCKHVIKSRSSVLLCTILFASSPALFWYSAEARMYSLLVLAVTWNLLALTQFAKKISLSSATNVILSSCAVFYVHYAAYFYLAAAGLFLLVNASSNKKTFKPTMYVGVICLLIMLPWLQVVVKQQEVKTQVMQAHIEARSNAQTIEFVGSETAEGMKPTLVSKVKNLVTNLASLAGVYPAQNTAVLALCTLPFIVIVLLFMTTMISKLSLQICTLIAGVLFTIIGVSFLVEVPERRYLIACAPLLLLLIGITLDKVSIGSKQASLALFTLLLIMNISGIYKILAKSYENPSISLTADLDRLVKQGEPIIVQSIPGQIPINYYLAQANSGLVTHGFPTSIHDFWRQSEFKGWDSPIINREEIKEKLDLLIDSKQNRIFWLVQFETSNFDPNQNLLKFLKNNMSNVRLENEYYGNDGSPDYSLFRIEI